MSRYLGLRRLHEVRGFGGFGRSALIAASVTALSLTASGCVVVHGEREVLPTTTRAEAATALQEFTAAYNKADKAYDSSLDSEYTTGALADIDSARLTAGKANSPDGNARHAPLKLTDAKFTIPKKAAGPAGSSRTQPATRAATPAGCWCSRAVVRTRPGRRRI